MLCEKYLRLNGGCAVSQVIIAPIALEHDEADIIGSIKANMGYVTGLNRMCCQKNRIIDLREKNIHGSHLGKG